MSATRTSLFAFATLYFAGAGSGALYVLSSAEPSPLVACAAHGAMSGYATAATPSGCYLILDDGTTLPLEEFHRRVIEAGRVLVPPTAKDMS